MNIMRFGLFRPCSLVLLALVAACTSPNAAPTPVPQSTNTPVQPTATATIRPTSTPRPTPTPNLAATKEADADKAAIQRYKEVGYVSSTKGTFFRLTDNVREMAQKNYLDYDFTGFERPVANFAAWADLQWTSAGPVNYPEYSGCGFGFRMRDNGDAYTATITKDSILITWCFEALGHHCGIAGKTRGSGKVKLGDPASVHFELVVNGVHAFALVNGEFNAEYTLFQDRLTDPGYFTYSIISGTNKDYGTRCTVRNGKIWVPSN